MQTFFAGSLEQMVQTFLTDDGATVSEEELARLSRMIEDARKQEAQS